MSGKWRPSCLGLDVLTYTSDVILFILSIIKDFTSGSEYIIYHNAVVILVGSKTIVVYRCH